MGTCGHFWLRAYLSRGVCEISVIPFLISHKVFDGWKIGRMSARRQRRTGCEPVLRGREETQESRSKDSNSQRSLERYNAIAAGAKLIGAGLVHHHGQPISQQTNAGFNRRGDAGPVGKDSGPSWIGGAGRENFSVWSRKSTCCPSR